MAGEVLVMEVKGKGPGWDTPGWDTNRYAEVGAGGTGRRR